MNLWGGGRLRQAQTDSEAQADIRFIFPTATLLSLPELISGMSSVKTVDEAILVLPKQELAMFKRLRALIRECLPKSIEEPKYGLGVPFYKHHRQICFIWPSSFYWGPKKKETSGKPSMVTLGFCYGNKMSNEEGVLHADGRKQVYCMYFKSIEEIDDRQIQALLYEAELIDEGFAKKKKQH